MTYTQTTRGHFHKTYNLSRQVNKCTIKHIHTLMSLSMHTLHLTTLNGKLYNHYTANLQVNGHVKFDGDWLNDKHIHSAHFLKGDPELALVGSLQDPVLTQILRFWHRRPKSVQIPFWRYNHWITIWSVQSPYLLPFSMVVLWHVHWCNETPSIRISWGQTNVPIPFKAKKAA